MANYTRLEEARLLKQNLEEQARLQDEINSGVQGYLSVIEKVNGIQKSINTSEKNSKNLEEEIDSLKKSTLAVDIERVKMLKEAKGLIDGEVAKLKKHRELMVQIVKETKTWKMLSVEAAYGTGKMLSSLEKIPSMIGNITNKFKDLFEMDKAIRQAGLEMGLINKQSDVFRKNIESAASNTISFGVGIKELAEIQSQYSQNIGRNVSMGQKDLEALAEIAKGTSLGAEATAQMAADFEAQGVSALKTKDYIQEAVDNSSAMGLNTSKVMSNLSQNVKMLNKYRFKDGVKGLVKMSELSAKLGVSMEFASSFADKLWDVEGAVETSAQLQVMGGAFARLADPFKLMYMARNDIAGLTEELANAASESASFNSETGKFDIAAMEMHRLKIIAQQTGISYEELTTAAQNAAKFAKIRTQIPFKLDKEAKEFIENAAQFDKNGKAYIEIDGEKKFLSQLGASGQALIQQQMAEKKSLKERAEASQSFDESLTNLINMVKMYMMPIVEGITGVLKPLVEKFMNDDKLKGDLKALGENIGKLVEWGATKLKWFTETIVDTFGVNGIFGAWLTGKGLLVLFDVAKWLANGYALSKGFLKGTGGMSGAGGAGGAGGSSKTPAGGYTKNGMPINKAPGKTSNLKTAGKGALAGAALGGISMMMSDEPLSGGGIGNMIGSVLGGAAGTFLDPFIGPLGTMLGAQLGGMLGEYVGGMFDEDNTTTVNDGIVKFNKNDKFTKVDDSTMIAGTNKNGNKDLASMLKYGMMASSPLGLPLLAAGGMFGGMFGGSNNSSSAGSSNKIEFGELVISGDIKINLPGGTQIGAELMKSQEFKTAITRVVTSQLEKNINGGKNKG
jgi:hypothetical protein